MSIYSCAICGLLLEYKERTFYNSRYYCPGTPQSSCLTLAKKSEAWHLSTAQLADIWDE